MNVMNVKWAQRGDFIEATATFSPSLSFLLILLQKHAFSISVKLQPFRPM